MKKLRRKSPPKVVKLESLRQINLHAAGIDIGAAEIYACVPEDQNAPSVRVFQTFTVDLYALADWLAACGVTTVAMEATGISWIPVDEILEARGFAVHLINARQLKNVPGRKTDVLDGQWIQQLHTYGLLRGSFRPDEEMCALRAYIRHRDNLIRYCSAHVQHMQKALHLTNVQLTNVISDITGVTGMQIIRAILCGERDPYKLAAYRNEHCAKSEDDIAKALAGNYRAEHLFALKQAVELSDFYNQQITACDQEIAQKYAAFKPQVNIADKPLPPRKRKRNKPEGSNRVQFAQRPLSVGGGGSDPGRWPQRVGRADNLVRNRPGHEPLAHRQTLRRLAGLSALSGYFGWQDLTHRHQKDHQPSHHRLSAGRAKFAPQRQCSGWLLPPHAPRAWRPKSYCRHCT